MVRRNAIPHRSVRISENRAPAFVAAALGLAGGAVAGPVAIPLAIALAVIGVVVLTRRARHSTSSRTQAVLQACDQVRIVFQPIVNLRTGEVIGYEALARFPTGRPDEWFAEAHALGLGVDLEMSAVVQAVAQRHPDWGYVSINVSPTTIVTDAFADLVARMTEPERLVVELTEHSLVHDYEELGGLLQRLRRLGVRVAVDDAGSGISSLRHILTIAPEIVKLDRSLISRLEDDGARRALGEALVQFANRVDAVLIAEGIEREEERRACLELGIHFGQGYLLGRPCPRHT